MILKMRTISDAEFDGLKHAPLQIHSLKGAIAKAAGISYTMNVLSNWLSTKLNK
jgi:hypothetical protein